MKKRSFIFVLSVLLVALIAVTALTGCAAGKNVPPATGSAVQEIGEGGTAFAFEVTDDRGVVTRFKVSTDEKTVGAALLGVGLIQGEYSDYGLFVQTVNGLTADFNANKAYWAFYVNGGYAASGVDSTDIEPDTTYAFVYTRD